MLGDELSRNGKSCLATSSWCASSEGMDSGYFSISTRVIIKLHAVNRAFISAHGTEGRKQWRGGHEVICDEISNKVTSPRRKLCTQTVISLSARTYGAPRGRKTETNCPLFSLSCTSENAQKSENETFSVGGSPARTEPIGSDY